MGRLILSRAQAHKDGILLVYTINKGLSMLKEAIGNDETWFERLQMLCVKFSHLGVGADLASLSLIDAWGLYVYLNRLANG